MTAFSLLLQVCVLCGLVWAILPSSTFKRCRRWIKANHLSKTNTWLSYPHLKRMLTPERIVENAIKDESFTLGDVDPLNELLAEIGHPTVECASPSEGDKFESETMNRTSGKGDFVLEAIAPYLLWEGRQLRKSEVTTGSGDLIMLRRIENNRSSSPTVVQEFAQYLREQFPSDKEITMGDGALQGFVDLMMDNRATARLLEQVAEYHPDPSVHVISPNIGDEFNSDQMSPKGGAMAGHSCTVADLIRPGLNGTTWSVNALVEIQND